MCAPTVNIIIPQHVGQHLAVETAKNIHRVLEDRRAVAVARQIVHIFRHGVLMPSVAHDVVAQGVGRVAARAVRVMRVVVHVTAEYQHQPAGDEGRGVKEPSRRRRREHPPLVRVRVVGVQPAGQHLRALRLGHVAAVHVYELREGVVSGAVPVAALHREAGRLDDLPFPRTQVVLLDGV